MPGSSPGIKKGGMNANPVRNRYGVWVTVRVVVVEPGGGDIIAVPGAGAAVTVVVRSVV
jgi:hypothetical protein